VITGAGSGIVRALALELARRGARLALSDIDGDAVRRTAEACRGAGAVEVESYQLDVSSREAVFAHADAAARTILRGIERDRPRILVGADARALDLMQRVLGSGYQRVVARAAARASSAVSLGAPWAAGEISDSAELCKGWSHRRGPGGRGSGRCRRVAAACGRGSRRRRTAGHKALRCGGLGCWAVSTAPM
jgi:hypothetical protein